MIDERYRTNALRAHLIATPLFAGITESTLEELAAQTLFETYGTFDWHVGYKRLQRERPVAHEPVIAQEGEHPDGLLLIRAGFARVSVKLGSGRRTLTYLGAGDHFALEELYSGWKSRAARALETTLSAVGYVDVLRVPTRILEQHVFPGMSPPPRRFAAAAARPLADDARLEWLVSERFINGNRSAQGGTVVINDDTCVGCATCANSCPYENITMVNIRDASGHLMRDQADGELIQKATKCDLCSEQLGGPACVRACPHDALQRVDFRELNAFG
jgi:ferredoxin